MVKLQISIMILVITDALKKIIISSFNKFHLLKTLLLFCKPGTNANKVLPDFKNEWVEPTFMLDMKFLPFFYLNYIKSRCRAGYFMDPKNP